MSRGAGALLLLLTLGCPLAAVDSAAPPLHAFGPDLWLAPGRVLVAAGAIVRDQGPDDGLEVLVALHGNKRHEALIELATADAMRVLTAVTAVLGPGPAGGAPADTLRGLPPRGAPVRVTVAWRLPAGAWRAVPAAHLIRDRRSDRALPLLPAVHAGVPTATYQAGPGRTRRGPVLAETGDLIALFDEENGAPLALAVPDPLDDRRWEANSALVPPPGTPVFVVLAPWPQAPDVRLTGRGLVPANVTPGRDFLVVGVDATAPRAGDREVQDALQARVSAASVIPVFVPRSDEPLSHEARR